MASATDLLTTSEVARRLRVSGAYVRRHCQEYRERIQAEMAQRGLTDSRDLPDAVLLPRPTEIACTANGSDGQWTYAVYAALLSRHVTQRRPRTAAPRPAPRRSALQKGA